MTVADRRVGREECLYYFFYEVAYFGGSWASSVVLQGEFFIDESQDFLFFGTIGSVESVIPEVPNFLSGVPQLSDQCKYSY